MLDVFPTESVADTRKYHVPSERDNKFVYVFEFVVAVPATLLKLSSDHCTVYAGFANPLPLSEEAVHVHVGVVSFVGSAAGDGVPGVVGAVVSTRNAIPPLFALIYADDDALASTAFTRQ